jgi:hypothetical protein
MLRPRDDIVAPLERPGLAALLEHERRGGRRDADERHLLHVGAIGVAGLEANLFDLVNEVRHRPLLAGRAGRTPFELVRR